MKKFTALVLVALAISACGDTSDPMAPDAGVAPLRVALGAAALSGSYIVVLKDDANPRSVLAVMGIHPTHVYDASIRGFSADLNDGQLNAVRHNPSVDYVETDRVVTFAPPCGTPVNPCGGGGGGGGSGQVTPWGVTRVNGPVAGATGMAWIIDTGIDLANADLNVDTGRSRNFVSHGKDNGGDDGNGHGTHVAGTIAAIDNNIDVVGVAPGATVVAVRVLNNAGSGSYSDVIAGVDYVGANGKSGDVANMSLGGPADQGLDDAVAGASAKVKFAIAAGNDGAFAGDYSPARVNGPNIYTISAIDSGDCMPSWSNWGNPPVDYAEPGVSILSLKRGGGTTTMSGTSMATPHAAGLLLVGGIKSGGTACNDQDNSPDPIGVH